jgi:hypothetical protein
MTKLHFASFWAGARISGFEAACAASFVQRGHSLCVFSFDRIENLPEGVELRDAGELVEERSTHRFLIEGRPSLSHFSDYFRYKLFQKTPLAWVDMDMLLLRPLPDNLGGTILAKEEEQSVCGAFMRIDGRAPQLADLIGRTESLMDRNLIWGETGPRLLTKVFGQREVFEAAHSPRVFFPIHFAAIWKTFLPEYRDECTEMCRDAYTVHLWNNIIDRIGVWKRFSPPVGSFLEERFRADGSLRFFDDAYPVDVMRSMIENWRQRQTGQELGLGQLSRQLIPGIGITVRKRLSNFRTAL